RLLSTVFFCQAEDGIRDFHVTGVQTCALPIFSRPLSTRVMIPNIRPIRKVEITMDRLWSRLVPLKKCTSPNMADVTSKGMTGPRSEERRVGKACRAR